jgi:hypothetical protein
MTTNLCPNFKHENGNVIFYHYGSKGRGIFTIGKCGAKFKILKCSKQTGPESFSPAIYFSFWDFLANSFVFCSVTWKGVMAGPKVVTNASVKMDFIAELNIRHLTEV